ncbi:hypothetical protein [Halorussus aquaticus]|uniref:Uncharacterized protein n=1 Tax=Halorussus aquaticus TaxID=2953748 RepID=A0ABD5PXW3_9EURY|nr:hypothetical protein [Halorussus aquaticus]
MPTPLVIGDVLSMLGLPHVVVVAVMAVAAFSHGQDVVHAVSFGLTMARLGTWVAVVVLALGSAAVLGLIPGVEASVNFGTLGSELDRLGDLLPIV